MDPIAQRKKFPNGNPKGNKRGKILRIFFFEEPSIDWGHRSDSLGIDELVCSPIVDLLDDVWSFPLWLELALRPVRHDDGPPEHEDQIAFSENALLDELVVSSHHILAVKLQVL
jgi:hypothetical protein